MHVPVCDAIFSNNFYLLILSLGGPGGQNVNKVNTKADIRFKVSEAAWIPTEVKSRLRAKYANKINAVDELVITSQKYGILVMQLKF
jgi:protein subunit release factor B